METKKAYIFLADGFEEVEALTVVDLLRRADIRCEMVSISDSLELVGRSRIHVKADRLFEDVRFDDADLLVLPGGMPGTLHLAGHAGLCDLLKDKEADKHVLIGAICAAPTVLGGLGLLKDKKATCFPGMEDQLKCARHSVKKVVKDERIITSRGLGTAVPFALRLIEDLEGEERAQDVAQGIVFQL